MTGGEEVEKRAGGPGAALRHLCRVTGLGILLGVLLYVFYLMFLVLTA